MSPANFLQRQPVNRRAFLGEKSAQIRSAAVRHQVWPLANPEVDLAISLIFPK